jgi:hypothetical protein
MLRGLAKLLRGGASLPTSSESVNKISLDRRIESERPLPQGVELYWQSDVKPVARVARSDFDFFQGQWRDARRMPDVTTLAPEALYRFTDVDLDISGGIRLRNGSVVSSPWLGARNGGWNQPGNHFLAGVIEEPIVSIALTAIGFGHWYLHRLSRLATAHREVPDRRIAMGVEFWNPPFMWNAFGLDPTAAFSLGKDKMAYWRVKDVLIPTYSCPITYPRVMDSERMRHDVADLTRGIGGLRGDGFGPEKIFLVRTAAGSVRNGAAESDRLLESFQRRGFVPVDIASLTFHDQVRAIRSARVIAGEVGSFSMNAIFAEPGLGVITVAARSLNKGQPYEVGNKTFGRAVTDAFEHHQRRIVASNLPRQASWRVDFDQLDSALDSMPAIP